MRTMIRKSHNRKKGMCTAIKKSIAGKKTFIENGDHNKSKLETEYRKCDMVLPISLP